MPDLDTPVKAGSGIGGMVTRKYGGIPAWVILLVVAGGAYLYIRSRGSDYSLFGAGTDSGAGGTDTLGSESAYDGGGTAGSVIYTIPAATTPHTNPKHKKHPAGGTKGRRNVRGHYTGKGVWVQTGKWPRKYPVRHPNK